MSLNRTVADAALKEDYQPAIREQLNQANAILAQIETNDHDFEGRRAVLSLHTGRNHGVGARAENGTLPAAGNQAYTEQRAPVFHNYGRIQVSGPVIDAMKSDKGSFTRAVASEVEGLTRDLKRDYSRQIFGTSNGVIAATGTSASGVVITLAATTTITQLRQFEVGMVIDVGTVACPTSQASARNIVAINRSALTITVDGANFTTTNGTHFIFRAGSGGAGASQKEITGLQTIVAETGALHNVNPSSVPVWASYVDDNGGTLRSPTDTLFERAMDEILLEGGEDVDLLVTTHGVSRAYAAGLKDDKRYSNTIDLKGGFKALSVTAGRKEVGLLADRDCPENQAFLLNTNHITHFVNSDWEWMDKDGAILSRVANTDAYEATFYKRSELATDKRNAHGKVVDLSVA